MATLYKYQILEMLGESMHSDIFKVHALNDPKNIQILRKIKPQFNSSGLKEYLQQQIEQLTDLELSDSLIPSIEIPGNDQLILVQPFFSSCSLTDWLHNIKTVEIENVLTVSIEIAQYLEGIHKAGFIHKGLKPNNILIKPASLEVQIVDNIRVLDVNQLSHFIYDELFCRHTLPYLAPEQTEKIKYSVNYSTDLYALGMVMYEALTGAAPFVFSDPITILHSHLAEIPKRVEGINPQVPKILADIIEQLLEKAPEKRYQTALGLRIDLEHCLAEWKANHSIQSFRLKSKDFSNRITIPSLMVGRDDEKQRMLEEFEKAASGVFRSALISGYSGIGKTRLIQELQLPIVSRHGYFCAGKFDQFKKHIPYSTLIQAFTHLIKTQLTEDRDRQQYWQTLIKGSLGSNARLITDLIPELELIIGLPEKVPDLPPVEARNRFNDTFGLFIACLAKKKHPLTLFIDDLQWCDSASFDLLEYIFTNAFDYPYLFWIGAYRHNEVDRHHRLTGLIKKASQLQRPLLQIRLDALTLSDVNQMTAYILNTYPSRTNALSKVIYKTSVGNPLFVNESLRWLHTYHHLHLNDEGFWEWDNNQLRHTKIPESALDLFKDKITKLPQLLQNILGIAAILGARFEVQELALTVDMSMAELNHELKEAFAQNILLREKQQIVFFHDQVQAAAEKLVDDSDKSLIHKQIATALIKAIPEQSQYEELDNLFSIVEHLSASTVNPLEKSACFQEARFNHAAGIVSLRSLAIESANYYFHQARNIYSGSDWDNNYDFLFSLYKSIARTEMALGHQDESERTLEDLIQHSNSDLDRADCLYEQTLTLSSLGQFKDSIATGNRALAYFNRQIPNDDKQAFVLVEQLFEQIHQNNRDIWQEILDIKLTQDRRLLIEVGIFGDLLPDYYLSGMVPQLYLSAIQAIQNCLQGGVDDTVSVSFSIAGLYLQMQGHYDLSLRYENLAIVYIDRYPDSFGATRGMNGLLWFISHNRETSETLIERCQQNVDRGKRCGDLYNAGLAYAPYIWYLIHQGHDINHIHEVAIECINFSKKYNLSLSLGVGESALMGWSALMLQESPEFSQTEIAQTIKKWEADMHLVSIGAYYILTGMAHYYLGNYKKSSENIEKAQPYLRGLTDNALSRLWYVFRYLNSLHRPIDDTEKITIEQHFKQIQVWAELGPILKPYLSLIIAEKAVFGNDFSQARRYYLDAIDISNDEGYLFLEAFIQQRLGELYLGQQHKNADMHLRQAFLIFERCGASIKAKQILKQYAIVTAENESHIMSHNMATLDEIQDVKYLLKASREISQQLDFKRFLSTVMEAIMKRLGAKNGYLLIVEQENLKVFARGEKKDHVEVSLTDLDPMATTTLSMAIALYVYHTGERILLENACQASDYVADDVVYQQQLKSVLCLPLLKQKKVLGVLYLENNLVPAIFTPQQIEQTELLVAQTAVALENTLLVKEMRDNHQKIEHFSKELEQRVEKRTVELNDVNEELKNFAYVVSHDLKAPLRAINQLSGWIESDYADAFDNDGREQMTLLRSRAKRMHDMIEGILQYSRIGRIKAIVEEVALNSLFADVVDTVVPPSHIKLEIQADLPIVMADKLRLFQVLQNLLDNAIKYNDKKQGIIQFSCEEREHEWCFVLKDNGIGIDKAHQQKVFHLFQTVVAKDVHNSTGVGLSLIEKSITNWGGIISLESELSKGCTFTFTLPKKGGDVE